VRSRLVLLLAALLASIACMDAQAETLEEAVARLAPSGQTHRTDCLLDVVDDSGASRTYAVVRYFSPRAAELAPIDDFRVKGIDGRLESGHLQTTNYPADIAMERTAVFDTTSPGNVTHVGDSGTVARVLQAYTMYRLATSAVSPTAQPFTTAYDWASTTLEADDLHAEVRKYANHVSWVALVGPFSIDAFTGDFGDRFKASFDLIFDAQPSVKTPVDALDRLLGDIGIPVQVPYLGAARQLMNVRVINESQLAVLEYLRDNLAHLASDEVREAIDYEIEQRSSIHRALLSNFLSLAEENLAGYAQDAVLQLVRHAAPNLVVYAGVVAFQYEVITGVLTLTGADFDTQYDNIRNAYANARIASDFGIMFRELAASMSGRTAVSETETNALRSLYFGQNHAIALADKQLAVSLQTRGWLADVGDKIYGGDTERFAETLHGDGDAILAHLPNGWDRAVSDILLRQAIMERPLPPRPPGNPDIAWTAESLVGTDGINIPDGETREITFFVKNNSDRDDVFGMFVVHVGSDLFLKHWEADSDDMELRRVRLGDLLPHRGGLFANAEDHGLQAYMTFGAREQRVIKVKVESLHPGELRT
jgi:hypothetical protein